MTNPKMPSGDFAIGDEWPESAARIADKVDASLAESIRTAAIGLGPCQICPALPDAPCVSPATGDVRDPHRGRV